MPKLTPKQKAFADYYIELGNATEAAIRAKYKRSSARQIGSENLDKPQIKAYIAEIMAQKDAERIASQDEILEFLTSVVRGVTTEQVPLLDGDGYQKLAKLDAGMLKDRVKSAELIGKRYAMWTDKKDINGEVAVTFVDNLDDDE